MFVHYFPIIFSWEAALWTVMSVERVLMWSQKKHKRKVLSKKNIDIFNLKQRHLRIDMKTKVVKHVARIKFSRFQSFQVPSACLTFRHFFSGNTQKLKHLMFTPIHRVHWVQHDTILHCTALWGHWSTLNNIKYQIKGHTSVLEIQNRKSKVGSAKRPRTSPDPSSVWCQH